MCSCHNEVFSLDDEYYNEANLIEIENVEELNNLVLDKKSFCVFLYLPGCTSCAAFKPVLEEYISNNDLTFYSISMKTIEDKTDPISKKVEYAPSLIIFKEGKIIAYLDAKSDDHIEYYKSVDGLSKWMSNYIKIKE